MKTQKHLNTVRNRRSALRRAGVEALEGRRLLSFSVGGDYTVSGYSSSVMAADFNGDGRADLATARSDPHQIRVMLGNANGTFTPGQQLLSTWPISSIAAGDVNGDAKIDLVATAVTNWWTGYSPYLQIFAGNGNGTFQAAQLIAIPSTYFPHWSTTYYASAVTIADIDADGKADLVAACQYEYPNSGWDPDSPAQPYISYGNYLAVLRGTGNGTFTPAFVGGGTETGFNRDFADVQSGDLNGDRYLDLVLACNGRVDVLLGAGNGTFSAGPSYNWPRSALTLADFNADGKTDLAAIDLDVTLALGDGNGGFAPPVNYPAAAPRPRSMATADFNRDGRPDLLVGSEGTISGNAVSNGKIIVLLNDRAGGFGAPLVFPCGPSNNYAGPFALAADFNGDARPDIVATSTDFLSSPYPWVNNIRLLINDGNWPVKTWIGPASGGNWSTAANWSPGGVPIASDVVAISASTVTLSASATVGSLTLTGGATLAIGANGNRVLRTSGLSIATGSKLDLKDNDLIVDYSGASPLAGIEAGVRSAYNVVGDWLGNGITSSTAAANGNFTLAVADNARLPAPFGTAQGGPLFSGVNVDLTTVLVKFTHRADLNLDGRVTPDDSAVFGGNYDDNQFANWAIGDMNYDGIFTSDDSAIFGGFYDESLPLL